jgi:hypothetical protein
MIHSQDRSSFTLNTREIQSFFLEEGFLFVFHFIKKSKLFAASFMSLINCEPMMRLNGWLAQNN